MTLNTSVLPVPTGAVMAVSGGASGLGKASAEAWIAGGGRVVIMDINQGALDRTVEELGERVRGIVTNVTSRASVDAAFASVAQTEGQLDALVCCAGNAFPVDSAMMTDEQFDSLLQVHLNGTMRCTRAAYPLLKANRGTIVMVSSVAGSHGMPRRASYNTVKHGLVGLTKSLAVEWASDGIRTNAIAPGYTRTPFNQQLIDEGKLDMELTVARIPMDRWAEPAEMANPIVFLSTDASSFINGHNLFVDGGMTIAGDWY